MVAPTSKPRRRRRPRPRARRPQRDSRTRTRSARGVLERVGEALADEEVGRALDRLAEPRRAHLRVALDRDAEREARRAALDRLDDAVVRQHRGMDARGELAQVLQRLARLDLQVDERLAEPARVAGQLAARQADARDQRDELLLGAVVDVALDLAPRRLLRSDDPRARGGELVGLHLDRLEAAAELPGELRVVQRERRLPRERLEQLAVGRLGAAAHARAAGDLAEALAGVGERRRQDRDAHRHAAPRRRSRARCLPGISAPSSRRAPRAPS